MDITSNDDSTVIQSGDGDGDGHRSDYVDIAYLNINGKSSYGINSSIPLNKNHATNGDGDDDMKENNHILSATAAGGDGGGGDDDDGISTTSSTKKMTMEDMKLSQKSYQRRKCRKSLPPSSSTSTQCIRRHSSFNPFWDAPPLTGQAFLMCRQKNKYAKELVGDTYVRKKRSLEYTRPMRYQNKLGIEYHRCLSEDRHGETTTKPSQPQANTSGNASTTTTTTSGGGGGSNECTEVKALVRIGSSHSISSSLVVLPLLDTTEFLSSLLIKTIISHLPPPQQLASLRRVYSTFENGTSLRTLYECSLGVDSHLLVARADNGAMFGAFSMGKWSPPSYQHRFSGNGQSFLFTFHPSAAIYRWSGVNESHVLTQLDAICFGAGADGFGLWLDESLMWGSSHTSATYRNAPLAGEECRHRFQLHGVEVWTFVEYNNN